MKNPKHPVTKRELVGGFNPAKLVRRPFGFIRTETWVAGRSFEEGPIVTLDPWPRTPDEAFVAPA